MERPKFLGEAATKAIESFYHLSVDQKTPQKTAAVRDIINDYPQLNLTIYFNHISFDDPAFIMWFNAKYIDPDSSRKILFPGSFSHTAFDREFHFAALARLGQFFFDYDLIRIVQSYQVNSRKYPYSKTDAFSTYRLLVKQVKELRKNSGKPLTLMISPEGHRSEDGALQEGERGIIHLSKYLYPNMYLPVGIVYEQGYRRDAVNFRRSAKLTAGDPLFFHDRSQKPSYKRLMHRLASTLPEKMRGVWQS